MLLKGANAMMMTLRWEATLLLAFYSDQAVTAWSIDDDDWLPYDDDDDEDTDYLFWPRSCPVIHCIGSLSRDLNFLVLLSEKIIVGAQEVFGESCYLFWPRSCRMVNWLSSARPPSFYSLAATGIVKGSASTHLANYKSVSHIELQAFSSCVFSFQNSQLANLLINYPRRRFGGLKMPESAWKIWPI